MEMIDGFNGVRLAIDRLGQTDAPCVVFMHGGGQTRHSWGPSTRRLADAGFQTINADLRGHGDSDWSPEKDYSIDAYAHDLQAIVRTLGAPPIVIGASLGGIAALLVAGECRSPELSGLVLVDVVPNMETEGADEIRSFMKAHADGFASIEEAARAVQNYIPDRPAPPNPEGLKKNLRLKKDGRYYWHWDPAMLQTRKTGMPMNTERLEAAARQVGCPALLVRGKKSRVVSDRGVQAFQKLIPHADFVEVTDADHMVAGDDNDRFFEVILPFVRSNLRQSV